MCAQMLLVSLLLLATVQTIQSSAYDALCPIEASPKNRTLLPHPTDCRKFLVCFNGVAHVPTCPASLHWNRERRACDYPGRAGCKVPSTQSTECVHGHFYAAEESCEKYYYCQSGRKLPRTCGAGFHWHQKQQHCVAPHRSDCQRTPFKHWRNADAHLACPTRDKRAHPVHLPYAGDCSLFLKCANGRAWVMECPRGLLWNTEKNHCDYAFLTKCPVKEKIEMLEHDSANIVQDSIEADHLSTKDADSIYETIVKNIPSDPDTSTGDQKMKSVLYQIAADAKLNSQKNAAELEPLLNENFTKSRHAELTENTLSRNSSTTSPKLEDISEPVASTTSASSEILSTFSVTSILSTPANEPVVAENQPEHEIVGLASSTGVPRSTTKRVRFSPDPHLPFRAPECLGDKNRVMFAATTNQQFYQCFEGFAYLLNCHGGYVFSTLASKCVPSASAGCK